MIIRMEATFILALQMTRIMASAIFTGIGIAESAEPKGLALR